MHDVSSTTFNAEPAETAAKEVFCAFRDFCVDRRG
jgi:hypothetical protein